MILNVRNTFNALAAGTSSMVAMAALETNHPVVAAIATAFAGVNIICAGIRPTETPSP
jgi:hypothetical protein